MLSHGYCRSDEISSRLATAMAELQRAKDAAAEKEGALLLLQAKVEELGKKVNPSNKELAEAQADVRAKRKEVEDAKLRVAEASRRFADLQKQAEMEHRKADAALREAEQKEAGALHCCLFMTGLLCLSKSNASNQCCTDATNSILQLPPIVRPLLPGAKACNSVHSVSILQYLQHHSHHLGCCS